MVGGDLPTVGGEDDVGRDTETAFENDRDAATGTAFDADGVVAAHEAKVARGEAIGR